MMLHKFTIGSFHRGNHRKTLRASTNSSQSVTDHLLSPSLLVRSKALPRLNHLVIPYRSILGHGKQMHGHFESYRKVCVLPRTDIGGKGQRGVPSTPNPKLWFFRPYQLIHIISELLQATLFSNGVYTPD